MSMARAEHGNLPDWRDLSTVRGQRYWNEMVGQELRIRGSWLVEHDSRTRSKALLKLLGPSQTPREPLTTSVSKRTGQWEVRRLDTRPFTPHRYGAATPFAPLTPYEASLKQWLLDGGGGGDGGGGADAGAPASDGSAAGGGGRPALLMSTMPRVGERPRPSTHHARHTSDLELSAADLFSTLPPGPGGMPPTTPPAAARLRASAGAGSAGGRVSTAGASTQFDRSRRRSTMERAARSVHAQRAEERRQQLMEGAAGAPRRYDGSRPPPPPLDRAVGQGGRGLYRRP